MYFASAKAVANLLNSAGCSLIGPNVIQEFDPFTLSATKIVAISKESLQYKVALQTCHTVYLLTSAKTKPNPNEQIIHTNCLPVRESKLRKSVSP